MNRFDQQMQGLNTELVKMGATVEQLLQDATKALLNADTELARAVIAGDKPVDDAENHITTETIRILATHQPVAGDLRFLSSIFRLVTDLERVADLAVNLAWRVIAINQEIALRAPFSPLVPEMALVAQKMLASALDAMAKRDDKCALTVCFGDNEMDDLHRRHRREMIELMQREPQLAPWGVEAILTGNYLERIGDHITNLGEEIVYLVRGQVLRHKKNK